MDSVFIECFSALKEPRVARTRKHILLDVLALSICGVLSGAEGWEEIEDFGKEHENWFRQFLELPHGIPSHDTISRIFSALDPTGLQSCCINWLKRISQLIAEDIIAVDGKALRGSRRVNECKKALHIINAWSCANRICLGQLKVEDKSNEIPAVPELLKLLYIKGAIVTLDAMGAQEDTVRQIREADADYVITLKGNQGALHETVKDSFILHDNGSDLIKVYRADAEVVADHGRIEERFIEVMSTEKLKNLIDPRWVDLKSIARITYTKTEPTGEIIIDKRHLISSLAPDNPARILHAARTHWQVLTAM